MTVYRPKYLKEQKFKREQGLAKEEKDSEGGCGCIFIFLITIAVILLMK
ncbi:hypothetical protein [Lactococcus garvieae]|uniref:Uncharacterized protein n=1 Tax=Lactococcus garvieae TaxID=1363 RepID=A0A1I4GFP9_9LACT|nr:hypothetical protein [Lactococcus garvieae]SFL28825.1 hypothetical protein SAMN05216438_1047 [Lactococcus garvieae]